MAFSLGPVADDGLYDIQVIRWAAFDVTFTSLLWSGTHRPTVTRLSLVGLLRAILE